MNTNLYLQLFQELDPLPQILEQLTLHLQESNNSQNDSVVHSPVMHDNIFR